VPWILEGLGRRAEYPDEDYAFWRAHQSIQQSHMPHFAREFVQPEKRAFVTDRAIAKWRAGDEVRLLVWMIAGARDAASGDGQSPRAFPNGCRVTFDDHEIRFSHEEIVVSAEVVKRRGEALREGDEDDERLDKAKASSPELNKPRRTLEQAKKDIARSNQEKS
jgi:hypothetical protein